MEGRRGKTMLYKPSVVSSFVVEDVVVVLVLVSVSGVSIRKENINLSK